jgi:hypothetical protein
VLGLSVKRIEKNRFLFFALQIERFKSQISSADLDRRALRIEKAFFVFSPAPKRAIKYKLLVFSQISYADLDWRALRIERAFFANAKKMFFCFFALRQSERLSINY